ncbi:MAG: T9SS type A sorting domain-containing protein [Candidatus Latescibacteria bacterium]|nr:T9SS type A sorting domain-containing protein [Candidatus Latescibacterota bacterium]
MSLRIALALALVLAGSSSAPALDFSADGSPAPPRAVRADSTWLFAPSGLGAHGEPGTTERGYSFDGFGECLSADWTGFGGNTVALRENDFLPGVNESCLWTFFDPGSANEDYPMGIIPYGPPYVDMGIQSPPLEVDVDGQPFNMAWGEGQIVLQFDVYRDLPIDPLIFYTFGLAGRTSNGSYSGFTPVTTVFYGTDGWITTTVDMTQALYEVMGANEDGISGVMVRLGVLDLCAEWCGAVGSGENHTLGPLFDNIQVCVVRESTAAGDAPAPTTSALLAPQPNPFNPKTSLRFSLGMAGRAELSVLDLAGRRVRRLQAGALEAGEHRVDWDGRDDRGHAVAAGVYLVQLETASERLTRKAVLLK